MSRAMFDLLLRGLWETLVMTGISGALSFAIGLPLALILVTTDRGGIFQNLAVNRSLGLVVNALRSVPFIILLVAVIPLTRLITGSAIGIAAAIVPLTIAAAPYYARVAEVSLREVDRALIDAARAMGATRWTILREVLIPEALPGIVSGFTVTLVTLIGASAMAGAVGAGGLGDIAIRYGYQRFETQVMLAVVVILIVMVAGLQWAGDRLARMIDRR
ncbi:methionine ABC transporter permease [Pseudogemmobacter blasticus]|uniref:ABC transporter permease n=1 Tax=Fuscovulum blasticum DSM 2131 TaxID=1188250 RepID=A0A2T4J406_FUSBL|nr:methionine ABC transporter permease [Fuscovulum blasticum]AWD23668.1 ABC transporter permease [Fuscovulum blasticum]PTE12639.1 ABC transporter permease [Fuscovulum blasticum DSM 2131]